MSQEKIQDTTLQLWMGLAEYMNIAIEVLWYQEKLVDQDNSSEDNWSKKT